MLYLLLSPALAGILHSGISGRRPWILTLPETLIEERADSKGRLSLFPSPETSGEGAC